MILGTNTHIITKNAIYNNFSHGVKSATGLLHHPSASISREWQFIHFSLYFAIADARYYSYRCHQQIACGRGCDVAKHTTEPYHEIKLSLHQEAGGWWCRFQFVSDWSEGV